MSEDIRIQQLDNLSKPVEVVEEPIVEPTPDPTPEPTPEPIPEPVIEPTPVVEEPVVKEPKKLELDVYDFIKANKETVLKVLDKDKDYSGVDNEQAIRIKLEKENPEWDKNDIEAELEEKYAIGLEKIVIDKDIMDSEEIKEAEAHNKRIDTANRLLKKDGKSAVEYLSSINKDVELPKYEYTFDETATPEVNADTILEQYFEQQTQQATKQREEQWIPELQKAIAEVGSIKEEVKYTYNENEVVLNVDYKLSEKEQAEILKQLSDYNPQVGDEDKYLKDGIMDVQRFVQDKSEEYIRKALYKTIAKEAAAKATQDFVKKDIVNYSEEVRNTIIPEVTNELSDFEKFMQSKNKQN